MNWLRLEMTAGQIFVLDGDEPRRWLHGEEPAVNEYGNKTGNSWYQEYLAGRLHVGQEGDGDSYGAVWAQSTLPGPVPLEPGYVEMHDIVLSHPDGTREVVYLAIHE